MIERVRLLIRQVGAAVPPGPGRQQRIARKIGISPSMLSKIERGQKPRLRDDTIKAILDATGLDPSFLFDESLGEAPDYRLFIRKRQAGPLKPPPPPPYWSEFATSWPRFADLTDREREQLQRMVQLDSEHTLEHWTAWIPIAEWLLSRRKRSE